MPHPHIALPLAAWLLIACAAPPEPASPEPAPAPTRHAHISGGRSAQALDIEGCEVDVRPPVRPKYVVAASYPSTGTVRVTLEIFASGNLGYTLRTQGAGPAITDNGPARHEFDVTGWNTNTLQVHRNSTQYAVAAATPTVTTTQGDRVEVVAFPAGGVHDGVTDAARIEIIHWPSAGTARALVLTVDRP